MFSWLHSILKAAHAAMSLVYCRYCLICNTALKNIYLSMLLFIIEIIKITIKSLSLYIITQNSVADFHK